MLLPFGWVVEVNCKRQCGRDITDESSLFPFDGNGSNKSGKPTNSSFLLVWVKRMLSTFTFVFVIQSASLISDQDACEQLTLVMSSAFLLTLSSASRRNLNFSKSQDSLIEYVVGGALIFSYPNRTSRVGV